MGWALMRRHLTTSHESGAHEISWAKSSWVWNFPPNSFYPHRGGSAEDARKIRGGAPRETIKCHHSWLTINFTRHIYLYVYRLIYIYIDLYIYLTHVLCTIYMYIPCIYIQYRYIYIYMCCSFLTYVIYGIHVVYIYTTYWKTYMCI